VAAGSRRVIAGVSGSLRSLGALRAGVAEAQSAGAPLLAVLAWAPAGGEVAYRRGPCPLLLRLWEQEACERLRDAFDQAFGGGLGQSAADIWPDLGGLEPSCAGDAPDVLAAEAGQAHEVGLTDAGFKGLDDRGVELVACTAELLLGAML
jgi:hypothetical protein